MNTITEMDKGSSRPQTYLPGADAREELLDFADMMRKLEAYVLESSSQARLVDPEGNERPIPDEIFRILEQVTNALAAGEGITVVPQGMLMTTQQAADFLGVSRPTLVRLLEAGDIPFEKPGRHRRVRLDDLLAYQSNFRSERRSALRELRKANLDAKIQAGSSADVKRRAELETS